MRNAQVERERRRELAIVWSAGGRLFARREHLEIVVHAIEAIAESVFVYAKRDEGDHGGENPEFGAAGDFGFRFPTKQLAGDFEGDNQAYGEGDYVRQDFAVGGEIRSREFQAGGEVGGRHEER